MQDQARNAAAFLSVVGIGIQGIICFLVAEGPVGGFHLGLFGLASLAYLVSLLLAVRTTLWLSALLVAVVALLIDLMAFYAVFVAPTSSTEALSLLVMPFVKLLVVVPAGLVAGVLFKKFGPRSARP